MKNHDTKRLLCSLLNGSPTKKEISSFAKLSNKIAKIYLKRKIASGSLNLNRIQLTLDDFSWDCVAELFERDQCNSFPQLERYFKAYDLENTGEKELFSALRRLIFSKVNDGIFRNLRTMDPALGKIIRNLKLGVGKSESIYLDQTKEMTRVVFDPSVTNEKPLMPVEPLKIRVTERITNNMFINDALEVVRNMFQQQNQYRRCYPLVELAKILRFSYTRLNDNITSENIEYKPEHPIYKKELDSFIEQSVLRIKNDMYTNYVQTEKMSERTFNTYFECVRDILWDLFVNKKQNSSYYEHLNRYLDNLAREEYRENHRGYIEYLVKKTRSDLKVKLKKEY